MVTLATVEAQLKQAGCNFRLWGRAEVRELCQILLPGETIHQALNGQYEAGFAMLVTTDFRVLLVDKKPKYLTLKDIRFDMITELDFANRLLDSTILIYTPNRELRFTSMSTTRLRKLFTYTQHKVMEIRHHYTMQQFQQQHLAKNTPPGVAMIQQKYEGMFDGPGAAPAHADPAQLYSYNPPNPSAGNQSSGQATGQAPHAQDYQPAMAQPVHRPGQDSTDEQRRLAAMMGAAGLSSIVHNGRVIKDYMTIPFTQRWRRRPYGYSRTDIGQQPAL